MIKYSIIVPVYNMSNLLPKCIENLRKQEYNDIEFIFVDDASSDNSFQICKEAEKQDKRVRVIRQNENKGLSSTRNLGMKYAKGEYLTFVDPDDYVETDFISTIEKKCNYTFDMIAWGMFNDTVYDDGHIEISLSKLNFPAEKRVKNATEEDWKILIMDTFFASACMRFYKTDIIRDNDLQFNTKCVDFEDYVFNISYCKYANSYIILDKAFYHYRQPQGQIATLKRKWETVEPFAVSDIVYKATEDFFYKRGFHLQGSNQIYFYVYKAYCNEIEYAYRNLRFIDFIRRVKPLTKNTCYLKVLEKLQTTSIKKYILLLLKLIKFNLKFAFSTLLWFMEYKELGSKARYLKK